MKIGDKVKVMNHSHAPNNGVRKSAWPIGSIGMITSINNPWDSPEDKNGVGIVDSEGSRLWGFHVDELEPVSSKNYIEFIEEDGIKFSLPRGSFFVSELPEGKARINMISRVNMWNVQETYEEVMKKVEE